MRTASRTSRRISSERGVGPSARAIITAPTMALSTTLARRRASSSLPSPSSGWRWAEVALDLRAVGLLRRSADARHVRAERRHAAPGRRVVAVRGGHVGVGECGQPVLGAGRDLDQPRLAVGQRALDGFGDQFVTRAEVLVEAAVSEPGGTHDLGHTRLLGPRLADASRSDPDDPLVAGRLVLLGVPHREWMIAIIHIR